MARVSDPQLFSTHFGVDSQSLDSAGLVDTYVNVDIPIFIDPTLLEKSQNNDIRKLALTAFRDHFSKVFDLLEVNEKPGDPAWKAASKILSLEEPAENGLGYSGSRRFGARRPEEIRDTIFETIKIILRMGAKNPEVVALLGFFEEGVGPDTISDFTTIAIGSVLTKITHEFCVANGVAVEKTDFADLPLPTIARGNVERVPVLLIPKDIVRDLPMANDWSGVWEAAQHNAKLRDRVSRLLAGIRRPTVAEQKEALRTAALESPESLAALLESVKAASDTYDPNLDALGYYKFRELLLEDPGRFTSSNKYDLNKGSEEVLRVAIDALDAFRHEVEIGNLWEELWIGEKPKRERAAQLFFAAIARSFCRANNIDLSPECDMGGGPVDFKMSHGHKSKVVIELKRSGGTVRSGYLKQLDAYRDAAETEYAIFVVIDHGDGRRKIAEIRRIREGQIKMGKRASEIVVIDASKKNPPSKRR